MNTDIFTEKVQERLDKVKSMLVTKGKEYHRNGNALHNFEAGSVITGDNPCDVLDGFLLKQYISYRDMLNDLRDHKYPTKELVKEKFGDLINYFIIQEIQMLQYAI